MCARVTNFWVTALSLSSDSRDFREGDISRQRAVSLNTKVAFLLHPLRRCFTVSTPSTVTTCWREWRMQDRMQPAVQEDGAPEKLSICHTHNRDAVHCPRGPLPGSRAWVADCDAVGNLEGPGARCLSYIIFISLAVSVIRMNIVVPKGTWCPPVCLGTPLITFEPICRILWNSVETSCHWRWPWRHIFQYHSLNCSKMADVETSETDENFNRSTWDHDKIFKTILKQNY
jgi:hypothetical protein